MAKAKANIVAHYFTDKTGMDEVLLSCGDANIVTYQADFKKVEDLENLWNKSVKWRNGIDVLINNAAIIRFEGGIDDTDEVWEKTWDETLAVNFMAPCNLMRKAVRLGEHLKINKKDIHNTRSLRLTEAKILRLVKYYRSNKVLSEDWKYSLSDAKLLVG